MAKTTSLGSILGSNDALARLKDHAARLAHMQRVVDQVMPRNLRGLAAVANFQNGTLTLHVSGPSLALRLNLSQDSLKSDLLAQGEPITAIRVRVRAVQSAPADSSRASKPRQIGQNGRRALYSLLNSLKKESPLNEALQRMLKSSAE